MSDLFGEGREAWHGEWDKDERGGEVKHVTGEWGGGVRDPRSRKDGFLLYP